MNLSNICQDLVKKDKDVMSVILSGSRARGDYNEKSDYDLIFITKPTDRNSDGGFLIKQEYKKKISEKTKIDKKLIQISVWPLKIFKEEHKKGNSFVYCALRDGKVLSSRHNLNLKQPNNCHKAAIDRMNFAKRNIEHINFSLKILKDDIPRSYDLDDLGYCSMHICWAVCMFNNFCPVSKYTALKECKKYFNEEEFRGIEKAYAYYADKNNREIEKEIFVEIFNILKSVLERIEKEYAVKKEVNQTLKKA